MIPRWVHRAVLVAIFVPTAAYVVAGRIWSEMRTIPFYVKCDLRGCWADARRVWRG